MRRALALPGCLVLLAAVSCSKSEGNVVSMVPGRRFSPRTMTVPAGTTITFRNQADDAHTVTAYEAVLPPAADYFSSGGFSSEAEARDGLSDALIKKGDAVEWTLAEPGAYRYFCIPHEADGMTGTIVVER